MNDEAKAYRRGASAERRRLKAKDKLAIQDSFNKGLMQGLTIGIEEPDTAKAVINILLKMGVSK